ncbi:hypothetical protein HID58_015365 [Brassica napus]|uniref:Uncharacterized protein n=1 Tax=Brassica napus TaxID=3708 RepID=A0ABQ8DK11_BRANA|nr:hypothetical protein HID58_015365 [Brassica napus]
MPCEIISDWIYIGVLSTTFAGYHHDADFVNVYIIIFSGARFSPSGNTSFYAADYTLFTLATRLTAQIYY